MVSRDAWEVSQGNNHCCRSGASQPSKDGPSITPVIISATTCGWPRRAARRPTSRQAVRMSAIWRKNWMASCRLFMASRPADWVQYGRSAGRFPATNRRFP